MNMRYQSLTLSIIKKLKNMYIDEKLIGTSNYNAICARIYGTTDDEEMGTTISFWDYLNTTADIDENTPFEEIIAMLMFEEIFVCKKSNALIAKLIDYLDRIGSIKFKNEASTQTLEIDEENVDKLI